MNGSPNHEKVLELEYQYYLGMLNILIITAISILLTIWLSNDVVIKNTSQKVALTISLFYLLIIFWSSLDGKMNQIKEELLR